MLQSTKETDRPKYEMVYAKEKWFSLMRNEVEKKQMVWGDHKRFTPLRDMEYFAEPPKYKCEMEQSMWGLTSKIGHQLKIWRESSLFTTGISPALCTVR